MTIQKRLARSNIAMLAIPLITAAALGVAIGELVYRPGHGGMGPSGGTPARQTDAALTMLRLSGKQKPPAWPEVFACSFYFLTAGCLSGRRTPGTW